MSQYAYAGFPACVRRLIVEVDTLKQNLERSKQELERAKKQLEDSEGKKIPCINVYKKVQLRKMTGSL